MKTRQDYMSGRCNHRDYYAQFVTPTIIGRVRGAIGVERLKASTRESFNDIPLEEWDRLAGGHGSQLMAHKLKEAGDLPSLCAGVCILKEAAQQIVDKLNGHKPYQPKTGAACSCKPGRQRDNCSTCEGTGQVIDFAAIRARR